MKNICLAFAVASSLSTVALAQQPQAVAKVEIAAGFVPDTFPALTTLELLQDGSLQRTKTYFDGRKNSEVIANFQTNVVLKIQQAAVSLRQSELVSKTPDRPQCMDAPTTTSYVLNGQSEWVKISGWANCHDLVRADGMRYSHSKFIESFNVISNISGTPD